MILRFACIVYFEYTFNVFMVIMSYSTLKEFGIRKYYVLFHCYPQFHSKYKQMSKSNLQFIVLEGYAAIICYEATNSINHWCNWIHTKNNLKIIYGLEFKHVTNLLMFRRHLSRHLANYRSMVVMHFLAGLLATDYLKAFTKN